MFTSAPVLCQVFFQKSFQVPPLTTSSLSSQETRPASSLRHTAASNLLAEEDLGLFSPPSSPEVPASSEERTIKKVLLKAEATSHSSISSSLDNLGGGASGCTSGKTSASPGKPGKGGDSWECEIDDLLGDDSDEEVLQIYDYFFQT